MPRSKEWHAWSSAVSEGGGLRFEGDKFESGDLWRQNGHDGQTLPLLLFLIWSSNELRKLVQVDSVHARKKWAGWLSSSVRGDRQKVGVTAVAVKPGRQVFTLRNIHLRNIHPEKYSPLKNALLC